MKFVAIIFVLAQAVLIQNTYGQVIRTALASPVIAQPSVANTLADTLSLLTVSSLLAETLPFNPEYVAVPVATPVLPGCGCGAPVISYPGCGCGCHCRNYGYNYVF